MFFTIYKTTHLESGKIYIGMHKTPKMNDGYLGSGTHISRAVKKHGRDAFAKEILFIFDTFEEMRKKEKEIVNEGFVLRDDTYNLNVGGDGSWFRANQKYSPEARMLSLKAANLRRAVLERDNPDFNVRRNFAACLTLEKFRAENRVRHDGFKGRSHSETAKKAISTSLKGRIIGEQNPAAKLTEHQVREARAIFVSNSRTHGVAALARRFGVGVDAVSDLLSRKTWQHI